MVKRYKGGLMGSTEAVTSTADARGLWGTVQATQARNTGNWPALLATETPGSGSGAGFANGFMTVSNVTVTDSSYNIINDTPNISTSGGYIKVTGRGFVSGCVVYVGGVAATTTTFISSTEVRAQIAAATSNTLMVYVVNPDGSTGIKLSSLVFSGTPSWVTSETLTSQLTDVSFSIYFSATSDSTVTYSLNTGSSLPPGTSLFANGLFTGTVTGLSSDTTYSFSVTANDVENQDTARTFSVTFSIGDSGFPLTSSLFNSDGNVWVRDSSVNNQFITVGGDTKPSAFSPYNYNQSVFFNGSTDYLSIATTSIVNFGTGPYSIEFWFWGDASAASYQPIIWSGSSNFNMYFNTSILSLWNGSGPLFSAGTAVLKNAWNFIQIIRTSTASNGTTISINGSSTTGTVSDNWGTSAFNIGYDAGLPRYLTGYLSDFRISNIARTVGIPSSKLTSDANTLFLSCQNSRFIDNGSSAVTITVNGNPQTKSFGPYAESDITSGSAYFDGTGDYLTIPDNAGMELGAGDFSFECWVYTTTTSGTGIVIDKRTASYGPLLVWRNLGNLQLYMSGNGSSWSIVNGVTMLAMSVNRWYHVAVYRVGSTVYYSINGTVATAATSALTPHNNSQTWYIGTETNASTNPWTGWICDMRFVVGSSPYGASNFTPPTSPLTAITNTQFLSLQSRIGEVNQRFIDESGLKHIITRTGDVFQGSFSPFSPAGWSAYFDGTGDYLSVARNTVFYPGANTNFTVEAWVFITSVPINNGIIIGSGSFGTNDDWNLHVNTSRQAGIYIKADSTNYDNTATTLSYSTWYHIAAVRNGTGSNNLTVYVNGSGQSFTTNSTLNNSQAYNITIGADTSATATYTGYISNLRMVNGLAVYTGNFTPPTTILGNTQGSGSNIVAITSGSTFLSLQDNRFKDNGTNAFTITRNGDAKIQAFSPFRASTSYNPVTHGGSAYFDGTGDYLTMPVNTATDLTQGNFTVEAWIYRNVAGALHNIYSNRAAATADGLEFRVNADNTLSVFYTGVGNSVTSTLTITAGQWYHVAGVRIGSTVYLYINGLQAGTASISNGTVGTGTTKIGADNGLTSIFNGYISGLRVVKGQGVFTGNFTVPTAPPGVTQTLTTNVAAMSGNVTLLTNFTNAGIVDYTTRNNIYTSSTTNTRTSNVQSKFGANSSNSLYFTGSYQYVFIGPGNSSTHPPLLPTIGDYTVECWVYCTASDTTLMCLNTTLSVFAAVRVALNANGSVSLLVSTSVANVINAASSAGTFAFNTWQHIAVVRYGGTHSVYVNGTSVIASTTIAATTAVQGGVESVLGCIDNRNNADFASFYGGYIDDFRTSRYARYTANFTPPTTAYLTR